MVVVVVDNTAVAPVPSRAAVLFFWSLVSWDDDDEKRVGFWSVTVTKQRLSYGTGVNVGLTTIILLCLGQKNRHYQSFFFSIKFVLFWSCTFGCVPEAHEFT
jgi:hypothetical protein